MTMIRVAVAPSSSSSSPGAGGQGGQVAGVQPDRAELGPGHLHRRPDALLDVVGVDQQRRPDAQRGHLRAEGGLLVVVQQRERVRAGARRRDPVAAAGLQVGARGEADEVRGARRGDRGLLVRAAGSPSRCTAARRPRRPSGPRPRRSRCRG